MQKNPVKHAVLAWAVGAWVLPLAVVQLMSSATAQIIVPPDRPPGFERTISVSGLGTVTAEPDIASISTGVVSEAETAKEAMAKNSAVMSAMIDALKASGLDAKDIQTTNLSVQPRYQSSRDGRPPSINGYTVHNQARIIVRDIKRLGDILDQAIRLGSNQISGISFEVSRADDLRDEARKLAMANAQRKAKLYAEAAGASLGQPLSIEEPGSFPIFRPMAGMARAALAGDGAAPPVEAGSLKLEAHVNVTFAIK